MIAGRVAALRERIARAAARGGRRAEEVTLVAVTKTFPAEAVREAFAAGVRHFGENRVQEAEAKLAALADLRAEGAVFRLIGHLQGNKARKALPLFDRLDALDSLELAQRLDRIAAERGVRLPVLVQVDLAAESTKHGVPEAELTPTLEALRGLEHLSVEGLMLLPPYEEDAERVRPYFSRLRELRDRALAAGMLAAGELSMGMSHDFEVALEEGASCVRLGTAIFGERG